MASTVELDLDFKNNRAVNIKFITKNVSEILTVWNTENLTNNEIKTVI